MNRRKPKIVVAITGASGAIYAKLLLEKLHHLKDQTENVAVVLSHNAKEVWKFENNSEFTSPFREYSPADFQAPFASGSAGYNVMIVVPCSMGTMGRIASGVSNDLITRAADVVLKERRKLILVTRDTPLNLIHVRNMETITLAGGIICPASPSFYSRPSTIEEVALTVVDRVLDLAGLEQRTFRWNE